MDKLVKLGVNFVQLGDFEKGALLDALRRDLREQRRRAECEVGDMSIMHGYQARQDLMLLEILQPKTASIAALPPRTTGEQKHATDSNWAVLNIAA